MNRENLFKAKSIETKEVVYGAFLKTDDGSYIIDKDKKIIKVNEDTICEFTNKYFYLNEDEKIWENDVIDYQGKRWTVEYCEELCGFQGVSEMDEIKTAQPFKFYLPLTQILEGKFIKNTKC